MVKRFLILAALLIPVAIIAQIDWTKQIKNIPSFVTNALPDPGANGFVKRTAANISTVAGASDVWPGTLPFSGVTSGTNTGSNTFSGINAFTGTVTTCLTNGMYTAGSSCYATILAAEQAACTASPNGAVLIPANYAGTDSWSANVTGCPTSSYPFGPTTYDLRSQVLGMSTGIRAIRPAIDINGNSLPQGPNTPIYAFGPADVVLFVDSQVGKGTDTSTTTVSAPGTQNITVTNANQFYLCANLLIEPGTVNFEQISGGTNAACNNGNWSIINGTTINGTFARAHTQPFTVAQRGNIQFTSGGPLQVTNIVGPSVHQLFSSGIANNGVPALTEWFGSQTSSSYTRLGGTFGNFTAGVKSQFGMFADNALLIHQTIGAFDISFQPNLTERFRVLSNGNIQIGTGATSYTVVPSAPGAARNILLQDAGVTANLGLNLNPVNGFYQSKISVAGCTTAASIGGICATAITVTWNTAFADTNYAAGCVPSGAPTNLPGSPYIVSKVAGSMTVNYFAITAAAAAWATVDCWSIHN